MKKFFRILGIIILLLIVIVVIAGLVSPKEMKVERTVTINGPEDAVFNQMVNLRNWENWIAWKDMDPQMKIDYSGTDGQPGSKYHWVGKKTGEGEVTITDVQGHNMKYTMHFKDWDSKANGFIRTEPAGQDKTKAVWGFSSKYKFPANGIMAIMNMKGSLEKDFDKGLQKLKTFVESGKAPMPSKMNYAIEEKDYPATTYAIIRKTVGFNDMKQFFSDSYAALGQQLGNRIRGNAVGIFYSWDEKNHTTDVAAGFPVTDRTPVKNGQIIDVPAAHAYKIAYTGGYSGSSNAHMALGSHVAGKRKDPTLVIEEYVTGPFSEQDSAKWLTNIYYLVP